MILPFRKCLGLKNKIGRKGRETSKVKKYFQVQFGDKNFYEFLLSIGLMPTKSRRIGPLRINRRYFADFLRGCIDGDGNISIVRHPESKHPQLRIRLFSASPPFLRWIQTVIFSLRKGADALVYAKGDSIKLLNSIYYVKVESYLRRKHRTAKPFLRM